MFACVVEQSDDVMVVETVERETAGPSDTHQPGSPKEPELVGHGGLGQFHERRQVADAAFAMRQGVEQPDTRGVAEEFEDFGHGLQGLPCQQSGPEAFEQGRVGCVWFGANDGHESSDI